MQFQDQVALITGSTRGIGREIARAFAREGAVVILTGRGEESAQAVSEEFRRADLKAEGFTCDVTNLESVEKTVNKILDKYKRIDILVNNAGVTKDKLLVWMGDSDWDEVLAINLGGVFHCTKVVSRVMLKASSSENRKGKIINISSIIGILGNTGQANYAASKAGIIGFTKSVAREFASRGITVNAVAPGYITTEMTEQLNAQTKGQLLNQIPLRRLGQPSDVAGVCLFLASSEADYITGQTIVVDGGLAI